MRTQINQTINQLKDWVMNNLNEIHANEAIIRNILKNEPVSNTRTQKIDAYIAENKKKLKLNQEAINLQMSLLRFIQSMASKEVVSNPETNIIKIYENLKAVDQLKLQPEKQHAEPVTEEVMKASSPDKDEIYLATINNELKFNKKHPYFNDVEFKDALMNYFIKNEMYERCDEIVKAK